MKWILKALIVLISKLFLILNWKHTIQVRSKKQKLEKRGRSKKRKVDVISIRTGNQFFGMKLYGDLIITRDGSIRLGCAQSHVSFGNQGIIGQAVEHNKETNCFKIRQQINNFFPNSTLESSAIVANNLPGGKVFSVLFQELNKRIEYSFQEMNQYYESVLQRKLKNQQFESFISYCFDYLKNQKSNFESAQLFPYDYNTNISSDSSSHHSSETKEQTFETLINEIDPSFLQQYHPSENFYQKPSKIEEISSLGMFTYYIGRLNWKDKDFQIIHNGYSKGYLEFIGLDEESLIALTLRQKRIDLIQNNLEITKYSAHGLFDRIMGNSQSEYISNIVSFDGFPIKIKQKSSKMQLPNKFNGKFREKSEQFKQM